MHHMLFICLHFSDPATLQRSKKLVPPVGYVDQSRKALTRLYSSMFCISTMTIPLILNMQHKNALHDPWYDWKRWNLLQLFCSHSMIYEEGWSFSAHCFVIAIIHLSRSQKVVNRSKYLRSVGQRPLQNEQCTFYTKYTAHTPAQHTGYSYTAGLVRPNKENQSWRRKLQPDSQYHSLLAPDEFKVIIRTGA